MLRHAFFTFIIKHGGGPLSHLGVTYKDLLTSIFL
ncbi:hypothetical protein ACJIZ3_001905 [Penstemon smallii]|uniref:Integrase n=1 Tax=Penstemon smallii TaxID=265156 RepID=A0ABD3U507_9LAMI